MWDVVPQPGIEATSPALRGRFIITGPPGNPSRLNYSRAYLASPPTLGYIGLRPPTWVLAPLYLIPHQPFSLNLAGPLPVQTERFRQLCVLRLRFHVLLILSSSFLFSISQVDHPLIFSSYLTSIWLFSSCYSSEDLQSCFPLQASELRWNCTNENRLMKVLL